jgi:hypothetical protein
MTAPVKDTRPITRRIRERLEGAPQLLRATMPTLDDLKEMLGIPPGDTSQDEAIESGFAATIAIVERYLGRGVAFVAGDVQAFEPVESRNRRLMLFRFPVATINSVQVDGQDLPGWRLFAQSGILEWRDGCCLPSNHCCGAEPVVTVNYDGGYADDNWPDDLMDAILRAFFARWHATGETGNTADMSSQGAIRTVAVDGSSVTWADHQATAQDYGAGPIPAELLGVSAILEPYRQRLVTGV